MKRFKHLLVHLDLQGAHDRAAIRHAAAVSLLGRSRQIDFVHTGPSATLLPGCLNDSAKRMKAWLSQAKTQMERLVGVHFGDHSGAKVRIEVLGGAGFPDLLDRLRQRDTDLILVGKSETNGAFVEKLTRKAPCSVMVVPPSRSAAYRRILVTTDFSAHSAQAMDVAAAFGEARQLRQLQCFHAYQIGYGLRKTGVPRDQFRQEMEAWAQEQHRVSLGGVDLRGLKIALVCQESPLVARAILQQAEQQRSDLLVMGGRGKDALSAALLGSTTAQVVRETPVPTLVVKPKGAGSALLDLLLGR
jgi:nucleotide-binding universal stress UspA family protein